MAVPPINLTAEGGITWYRSTVVLKVSLESPDVNAGFMQHMTAKA